MQEERFTSRPKMRRGISCRELALSRPQQPHARSVSLEIKDAANRNAVLENAGLPVRDRHGKELQIDAKIINQSGTLPSHKHIRALRRQLEVSQLEVALHVGISQSQYSLFEQGYVRLPLEIIQEIDALLDHVARRETDNG